MYHFSGTIAFSRVLSSFPAATGNTGVVAAAAAQSHQKVPPAHAVYKYLAAAVFLLFVFLESVRPALLSVAATQMHARQRHFFFCLAAAFIAAVITASSAQLLFLLVNFMEFLEG